MTLYHLLFIPIIYIPIKIILYYLISKFGKISYEGFNSVGFIYDSEKDIFYTTKNAWQKKLGYCYFYEVLAPIFRIILDTESIKFYYNNKNYLINFWKGQYGIVTGAEIGVYYTSEKIVNKNTLYLPLETKDFLDMSFTLYKNNKEISKIGDRHWWLSTFKIGMFSKPKELVMDIKINFPNKEMLKSFLKSFIKKGYSFKDFTIIGNTFIFIYKRTKTKKAWTRNYIIDEIRQYQNKKNILLYNNFFSDFIDNSKNDNLFENKKVIIIDDFIPKFLKNNNDDNSNNKEKELKQHFQKNIIFLNDNVYSNMENANE